MTLREKIEPLLEDFKRANGKGSMAIANIAMVKIIEAMVDQLEMEHHLSLLNSWVDGTYEPELPNGMLDNAAQPTPEPDPRTALLEAVHALHEANYVIGADYTAIVEHLKHKSPDDLPIKIRNKPGRKTNSERLAIKSARPKANSA